MNIKNMNLEWTAAKAELNAVGNYIEASVKMSNQGEVILWSYRVLERKWSMS